MLLAVFVAHSAANYQYGPPVFLFQLQNLQLRNIRQPICLGSFISEIAFVFTEIESQ